MLHLAPTGYPPTDVDPWKRVFRAVRAHGLNHVRFHSWCPPKAAFVAADELGVYLQVECGDLDSRIAARRFRRSLFKYMADADFRPKVRVEPHLIRKLFN